MLSFLIPSLDDHGDAKDFHHLRARIPFSKCSRRISDGGLLFLTRSLLIIAAAIYGVESADSLGNIRIFGIAHHPVRIDRYKPHAIFWGP